MKQIFKDEQVQRSFEQNGFVTLPFLNQAEVSDLHSFYNSLQSEQSFEGFHCSMFHKSPEYKSSISKHLIELGNEKISAFLNDYSCLYGNFMVKEPGPEGEFKLHQDWSYVDEDQFTSLAIWIPLVDLDTHNGCLQFVSGTQHINNTHRGPGVHFPYTDLMPLLMQKYLTAVPMKAGEAVIWDHRVLHYSTANLSDKPRIAATMIIVPEEAEVFHFYKGNDEPVDRVNTFKVNHDFFMHYAVGEKPVAELVSTDSYWYDEVTEADLIKARNGIQKPEASGFSKLLQSFTKVFQNN